MGLLVPGEVYMAVGYYSQSLTEFKAMFTTLLLLELENLSQPLGFPGGTRGKEPCCQCRRYKRSGFTAWGKSPGEGHGEPPQYSCLENPMDRGAEQVTVHRVAKRRA